MRKLRELYDAAKAADGKKADVLARMQAAFELGTDEGTAEAMGMRAELDAAQTEAEAANELYVTARDESAEEPEADPNANARKFVPVSADAKKAADEGVKQITRAQYEAMDYAERHAFLKAGGAIVDQLDA